MQIPLSNSIGSFSKTVIERGDCRCHSDLQIGNFKYNVFCYQALLLLTSLEVKGIFIENVSGDSEAVN